MAHQAVFEAFVDAIHFCGDYVVIASMSGPWRRDGGVTGAWEPKDVRGQVVGYF
jgi:hypothetical protein